MSVLEFAQHRCNSVLVIRWPETRQEMRILTRSVLLEVLPGYRRHPGIRFPNSGIFRVSETECHQELLEEKAVYESGLDIQDVEGRTSGKARNIFSPAHPLALRTSPLSTGFE